MSRLNLRQSKALTNYRVQMAMKSDLAGMAAVEEAAFGDAKMTLQTLEQWMRCANIIGKVAILHDHIVGHAIYRLDPDSKYVVRMVVHPALRRQGLGRAILMNGMSHLTENRNRLVIDVDERNLNACQFLRACGVRAIETLRDPQAIRFQVVRGEMIP